MRISKEEQEKLRNYCSATWRLNSLEAAERMFKHVLQFHFYILLQTKGKNYPNRAYMDASMLQQMIFAKTLHIRKMFEGIDYDGGKLGKLNTIIDPTNIGILIRNVYETISTFHLIYVKPNSDEERELLYNLWVIAGLKYRQRFSYTTEENEAKKREEGQEIETKKQWILNSSIFKNLDEQNQKKILNVIRQKDYKIIFEDAEVKVYNWSNIHEVLQLNQVLYENMYTYFSLFSHPSNVSVFQFNALFSPKSEDYKIVALTGMEYLFSFLSIFLADFIRVFPDIGELYNKIPEVDQILLNFHNTQARGRQYSINDTWKILD